jgi:hypothetical protein
VNITAELSPLRTAAISENIPPQVLHALRGRCLGLRATCHLREACWEYLSEATAAGFCVGEAATLFLNGAVERLRLCEVGGRHTSTRRLQQNVSFF